MIARISNGASFYGVLAYNGMKVGSGEGKVIACNNMAYASRIMQSGEIPLCLHTFDNYVELNSRIKKPVFHASLNPHPNDKLDEEQLSELAREYMVRMGYGDQPYIVYEHNDIDRSHLHIVSVRVDTAGNKIDHNNEGKRSKIITEELEREYDLIPAVGSGQELASKAPRKVDYVKGDVKRQVKSIVQEVLKNYRFASTKELNTLLNMRNVSVEAVIGNHQGKDYSGVIYGALDDNWGRVGKPFKSSLFGKGMGFEALYNICEKTKAYIKESPEMDSIRTVIRDAKDRAENPEHFEQLLAAHKIEAVFRKTKDDRIFGATFIDHNLGIVINGSRLGEEFKAAQFQKLFGEQSQQAKGACEIIGADALDKTTINRIEVGGSDNSAITNAKAGEISGLTMASSEVGKTTSPGVYSDSDNLPASNVHNIEMTPPKYRHPIEIPADYGKRSGSHNPDTSEPERSVSQYNITPELLSLLPDTLFALLKAEGYEEYPEAYQEMLTKRRKKIIL